MDALPKISMSLPFLKNYTEYKIEIDKGIGISFLRELGFSNDRILTTSKNLHSPWRHELVYGEHKPHFVERTRAIGLGMREAYQNALIAFGSQYAGKRDLCIYLDRDHSRKVENQNELLVAIEDVVRDKFKLCIYKPKNDWKEDRHVLKRAALVIGPHGGAFANILFCREGTDVVEFSPLISCFKKGH